MECKMHVGVQGMGTSKIEMEFLRRHGVTHMNAGMADHEVETLVRHKRRGGSVRGERGSDAYVAADGKSDCGKANCPY